MAYSWGDKDSTKWKGGKFNYGDEKKSYTTKVKKKTTNKKDKKPPEPVRLEKAPMDFAYIIASRIVRTVLPNKSLSLLNSLTKNDIIVLKGTYDYVEKILDLTRIPYKMVTKKTNLTSKQILLVNCPGKDFNKVSFKEVTGKKGIKNFVKAGGFLITTDWSLDSIIPQFKNSVKHGGKNTGHDVVEIDLVAAGSPYTNGMGGGSLKPLWWLETSSYPISVLNKEKVDILLGSKEMKKKYGEMPIAVKFSFGRGRVVHIVSHFYLQYFTPKYAAQANKTGVDFVKRFLAMKDRDIKQIKDIDKVCFGAIEAAYTSVRFLFNIFIEKLIKVKK